MNNNEENLKILLILLNKAEQILSIINLPDNAINKYNQLKELTFDKLYLDFQPLTKIKQKPKKDNNSSLSNLTDNPSLIDNINKLRVINNKKNIVIDFLFDLIEKFKFEDNAYMKQFLAENSNSLLKQLDKSINNTYTPKLNVDELDFELKLEDIKLKDYIGKSEINYKKFLSNINTGNSSYKKTLLSDTDITHNTNMDEVIRDYERKLDDLRRNHEREIREYREKFNEMKVKYNPDLEADFYNLKNVDEERMFLIEKINEMMEPIHEKYYSKNASWYEKNMIDFKFKELERLNFLISLVNKFFSDNKYLIELVSETQKEKNILMEERSLPYVINAVQKNNVLNEINESSKILEQNSENFHKNFEQILEYINKNLDNI